MLRVLTWNLFHGRSVPTSRVDLAAEFAATIAGWEWDVALLQECPPWWPEPLGRACGAHRLPGADEPQPAAAASRDRSPERRPDVIKSWGGGCNAILVRGDAGDRARPPAAAPAPRAPGDARGAAGERQLGRERPRDGAPRRVGAVRSHESAAALDCAGRPAPPPCSAGTSTRASRSCPASERGRPRARPRLRARADVAEQAHTIKRGTLSDHRPVVAALV